MCGWSRVLQLPRWWKTSRSRLNPSHPPSWCCSFDVGIKRWSSFPAGSSATSPWSSLCQSLASAYSTGPPAGFSCWMSKQCSHLSFWQLAKSILQRIMMWQSGHHLFPLLFQHPLGSVLWMSNWWFVRSVKTFLFYCQYELKFLQHCAYVLLSKRAYCPSFDRVHTQNITARIIHWCCIKSTCLLAIFWPWTQTKSLADHLPGPWNQ